jgi:fructose-1,6-bisphosphatase II
MLSRFPSDSPLFVYALRQVTEAAARAAYDWIGRGRKDDGDGAAVHAMRQALGRLCIDGVVVIGEGAKDGAPELHQGERIGRSEREPEFDIAVDPVEGTTFLAKGLTNAMAVIGLAPRGTMLDPGPCFYMAKLAAPPAARGRLDPEAPTAERLRQLADALDKPIEELTVYVLEKPRHNALIAEIHSAGARVALYPAGDVAGAIMAAIPGSGIDALMGTGGTPEGILAACAVRGLGGVLYGRLDPQLQTETREVVRAALDTTRWHDVEELVASDDTFFCATGITSGLLIEGVSRAVQHDRLQTLMIVGRTGERQVLTSWYPHARPAQASAEEKRCLSIG